MFLLHCALSCLTKSVQIQEEPLEPREDPVPPAAAPAPRQWVFTGQVIWPGPLWDVLGGRGAVHWGGCPACSHKALENRKEPVATTRQKHLPLILMILNYQTTHIYFLLHDFISNGSTF